MQHIGSDDGAVQRRAEIGEIDPADLIDDDRLMPESATSAAIFLGDCGAQQPSRAGFAPQVAIDHAFLAPARGIGRDLALGKAADRFSEHR